LAEVLSGAPGEPNDRTMTVGELQEAARIARAETGADAGARAAGYEVEIQKKYALAAACLVLALLAAVTAMRFPRGGLSLVFGASGLVFTGYYVSSIVGESLADRQLLSPLVAMWMANAVFLAVALVLAWRPRRNGPPTGEEILAVEG
ncbi:MAG TPA: LptF/LptG family permease, partial [Gemmatimonadales bacterium]|nr:LptF/LptG family permease [Gemmatimonadales bacterium]